MTSQCKFSAALVLATALTSIAHAEGKATICYSSARSEALAMANESGLRGKLAAGTLGSFDNINDVQVEGWNFKVGANGVIVILGIADGGDINQPCRTSLVYSSLSTKSVSCEQAAEFVLGQKGFAIGDLLSKVRQASPGLKIQVQSANLPSSADARSGRLRILVNEQSEVLNATCD